MLNRYIIIFSGDEIGNAKSFKKAKSVAKRILDLIQEYPLEEDEHKLLFIHRYSYFDRLFNTKKYKIFYWNKNKQKFTKK